ncbi:MAG: beta-hydroxyacyl-ACP dehydratase [Planctomycetales bacterium]|nr:beta-hydroxyacyl-ACP dehydratase [Planctomycetales bacterium]
MRWFWMDRFTELNSGKSAEAVKTVSLSESALHDHFYCIPTMPNSLILEGMAQTSGMLVSEYNDFRERVILAKVPKVQFYGRAVPGDTLVYRAVLEDIDAEGARATTTSHVGDRLQAEAEILFVHLDRESARRPLFEPGEFLSILRVLKILEVARKPDGSRIPVPQHLL